MGVESVAYVETLQICKSHNLPLPQKTFADAIAINFQGETVICRYFGAGHTIDNILVYFPASQILFGGCLIKSMGSKGLGNTKEADIEDWDKTVLKVKTAYPSIKLVIPGHGTFGDIGLLEHTITLVKDYKAKKR